MIALATALVESNMLIYANQDDPESLKYPHDVIGIRPNEKRVGLFKQNASSGEASRTEWMQIGRASCRERV